MARTTEIHLTKTQAEEFYADKKDKPYFHDLIEEMTRYVNALDYFLNVRSCKLIFSGPLMALYLVKGDAVHGFRTLLGPTEKNQIKEATGTSVISLNQLYLNMFSPFIWSFRNEFDIVDAKINSMHGARTHTEVNRNLHFFFPEERLLVLLKPNLSDQQRGKTSRESTSENVHRFFRSSRRNRTSVQESWLLYSGS